MLDEDEKEGGGRGGKPRADKELCITANERYGSPKKLDDDHEEKKIYH
jgi:hypothetical protein